LEFILFLEYFSGLRLKDVVKLPEGELLNDWIAVHGENDDFNGYPGLTH
jgi:hypothetical protein